MYKHPINLCLHHRYIFQVKSTKKYVSESGDESADVDDDDHLVSVYEVWSLKDLTVYTICEGSQQYVRPPFQPQTLGEQWYPFFGLQLRRVDGKKYPRSMVEQLVFTSTAC